MKPHLLLSICLLATLPCGSARADFKVSGEIFAETATRDGVFVSNRVFHAADRALRISNKSIPFGLPSHAYGHRYGQAAFRLDPPVTVQNDPQTPGDATLRLAVRRGEADTQGYLDLQLVGDQPEHVYSYRVRTLDAPLDEFVDVTVDLDRVHHGDAPSGDTVTFGELRLATGRQPREVTQVEIASIAVSGGRGAKAGARAGAGKGAAPQPPAGPVVARLNTQTFVEDGGLFGAGSKPGVFTRKDGYFTLDNGVIKLDEPSKLKGGPRFVRLNMKFPTPLEVVNDPEQAGDAYLEIDYRRGAQDQAGQFFLRLVDSDPGEQQSFSYLVSANKHGVKAGAKAFSTVRIDLDKISQGDDLSDLDLGLRGLGLFTRWKDTERTQIDLKELRLVHAGPAETAAPKQPAARAALPPALARLNPSTFREHGFRADGAAKPGVVTDHGHHLTLDSGAIPLNKATKIPGGPRFCRIDAKLSPPLEIPNNANLPGDYFIEVDFRRGPDDEAGEFFVRLVDQDDNALQSFAYYVDSADHDAHAGDEAFTTVRIDLDDVNHRVGTGPMDYGLKSVSLMTRWRDDRRVQLDVRDIRVMRDEELTKPKQIVEPG